MKILKIKFQNINSLRGEHEVDFTSGPLHQSRLFAITGPTGSGKSTLLDVISLALFNKVPRLGKNISTNFIAESGALLTRNTREAYATVEYECKGGIFRSSWSISTNRNDVLNQYAMELVDAATNQHFDLKKSEVPAKNEELIGLNYDQFVKSIVLAQGAFAEFLKVDKNERSALLEKITGTGIYRRLGQLAFEKKSHLAKELEDLRNKKSTYAESLLEPEDLEATNKQNTALSARSEVIAKSVKTTEAQLALREEITKLEKQKEAKETDCAEKQKVLNAFEEEHGAQLKKHEQTAPFAEQLDDWKSTTTQLAKEREKQAALTATIEQLQSDSGEKLRAAGELLNADVTPEDIHKKVETFRQKVQALDNELKERTITYRGWKSELQTAAAGFDFSPDASEPASDREKLREMQAENEQLLTELEPQLKGLDLSDPEKENEQLETRLENARNGKAWSAQLTKLNKQREEHQSTMDAKTKALKEYPALLENLKSKREKFEAEVKSLQLERENQQLRASLEEKRKTLKDGEPCALCGATEHPWASHAPPEDDALAEKGNRAQEALTAANKEFYTAEEKSQNLAGELKKLQETVTQLDTEMAQFRVQLKTHCSAWLKDGTADWESIITHLDQQRRALRDLQKAQQHKKGIAACLPLLEKMLEQVAENKKLRAERNALYAGKEDIDAVCATLIRAWDKLQNELATRAEDLKKLQEAIHQHQAKVEQIEKSLVPALQKVGFEDISSTIASRLPEMEFQRLSRELNQHKQNLSTAQTELKAITAQLAEKVKLRTEETKELLAENLSTLQAEQQRLNAEWDEVKHLLKRHQDAERNIAEVQKKIAAEEKTGRKWELLNILIGDRTGNKFNQFAQDLTLEKLLLLANRRLTQLTDRYLVATPDEGEESNSLIAVDQHMGGQRRSVKTLSGGETFVVSLALALALSDLASRNVEINSLFIDEGFGTLDPETLDQTLDTLEKLQTESAKTIGIISHVEALKERISTQIQLERNGQGYSKLTVRDGAVVPELVVES